jgi:hypothetical protein
MKSAEGTFLIVLGITNLVVGFGCAMLIAASLRGMLRKTDGIGGYFVILVIIYLLECVAFAAGMATQVLTVGLAFVWAISFWLWLRSRAPSQQVIKVAFFLSLYTSLPTASFCILLPLMWWINGRNILSAAEGVSFGIPHFFPSTLQTILGFCVALLVGTTLLKTTITTGGVALLLHLRKKPITENH